MKIFRSVNPNIRIDKNGTITSQNRRSIARSLAKSRSFDSKLKAKNIQAGYVGRDKLNMPIQMTSAVVDTVLYEDSNDPTKKYYLPRYELATEPISGNQQFRIELSRVSGNETLTGILKLFLNKTVASELKDTHQQAEEIPHDIILDLTYKVGDISKELPFQEISIHESSVEAVLSISNPKEFDQVFIALTESSFKAKLVIQRQLQTALPLYVPVPLENLNIQQHKPSLAVTAIEEKNGFTKIHFGIRNRHLYTAPMFVPSPTLPAAGFKKDAARTWVDIYSNEDDRIAGFCALSDEKDLENLWIAYPKNRTFTNSMYAVLEDRKTKKKFTSKKISIDKNKLESVSPLFKQVEKKFRREEDFTFPKETNEYIYRKAGTSTNQQGGYLAHQVKWNNIEHVYLQDEVSREKILFLPDEFRLARTTGDSRLPWATVIFQGESFADITALIEYRIDNYIDYDRIQDAAKKIIAKLDEVPEEGLFFQQLTAQSSQLSYKLKLPKDTGFSLRTKALVNLDQIKDTLPPLSIDDFTTTFDTLSSTNEVGETLRGQVEVAIKGLSIPSIPVSIRFAEVGNDAFRLEQTNTGNNYKFTLYNTIESPITVGGLSLILQSKDKYYKKKIEEHQAAKSIDPGSSITFSISSSDDFPINANSEIIFDWNSISVDINKDNIYDLIIDPTVSTSYKESIKVQELSDSFREKSMVKVIEVMIRANATSKITTTTFTKDKTEQEVQIYFPIKDIVLGQSTGEYEYKVEIITTESHKLEWEKGSGDLHILIPNDLILPPPSDELQLEEEIIDLNDNFISDSSNENISDDSEDLNSMIDNN